MASASVLLVIFFLPFCAYIGILVGKRRAAANARRIEEYRTSPESHLLNLHD